MGAYGPIRMGAQKVRRLGFEPRTLGLKVTRRLRVCADASGGTRAPSWSPMPTARECACLFVPPSVPPATGPLAFSRMQRVVCPSWTTEVLLSRLIDYFP